MSSKELVKEVHRYTCDVCGKSVEGDRELPLGWHKAFVQLSWRHGYLLTQEKTACSEACIPALLERVVDEAKSIAEAHVKYQRDQREWVERTDASKRGSAR